MQNINNTFFTKDIYDNEIRLDVNADVLGRIHNDGVTTSDKLPIDFVFITDTEDKANSLKAALSSLYTDYQNVEVSETKDFWEINGITSAIGMTIDEINKWNEEMWDIGYKYDCQLDGWQVGVRN
ncbi:ribonuclease E inhibitor RraB [Pedobacter frigoris]|uniref:ribonuclease E inhibitor RraB n=1 Tax=Pedobacter frigoris TaxID=2571272 RepID=UPI00293104B3|nr:ribonuclease E inhibitor RraB [Pedobacter frigoris]